eukprot:4377262-Heterocapsa_arctica.AAC.1
MSQLVQEELSGELLEGVRGSLDAVAEQSSPDAGMLGLQWRDVQGRHERMQSQLSKSHLPER